jgi:membrane-bound lytic murein transglycosylase F
LLNRAIPILFRSVVPVVLLVFLFSSYPTTRPDATSGQSADNKPAVPESTAIRPEAEQPRQLRILIPDWPGAPEISAHETALLDQFARTERLEQRWIPVADVGSLRRKLEQGEADIVAALREPIKSSAGTEILTTLPWAVSRRQVIGRTGSRPLKSLADLTNRQIAVRSSSPVWPLLSALAHKHPGMQLVTIADNEDVYTVFDRVRSGRYDLAVVDSLLIPADLDFSYNLAIQMDLSEDTFLTWAVRGDADALQKSLNRFLNKKHLELETAKSYREDFSDLKKRKMLRLVTSRGPVNYFHDRGRLRGFEYELIKKFAENHGMRLDVVIADTPAEMQQYLNEGNGDVIAASMPASLASAMAHTASTLPYNHAYAVIAGREGDVLANVSDLEGRVVHIAASSPYLPVLEKIRDEGTNLTIMVANPGITSEALLFRVAQGIYDLTVIGSHEVNAEFSRQLNLKALLGLGEPDPLVWLVRQTDSQLLTELNKFIDTEYRKGFYNVIYSRYIEKPDRRNTDASLFANIDQLSPYDDIVHKYADHFSFDWRLIVALMYQESRFNPRAVSSSGASGLMQVLPATAQTIGVGDLENPDNSIHAGVLYLDRLRSQFEEELPLSDRLWFALAAYNSGYNRVQRARSLAEKMKLDKNRWFNNVELAMLKMGRPYKSNGETVRDCQCGQTVAYVREISTLYNNYLRLTRSVKAAAETPLPREKS